MPGSHLLRGVGVALAAILYAVLTHESNLAPAGHTLGAVLAVGPLLILAGLLAWRAPHRYPYLLLCVLTCFLVNRFWPVLTQKIAWINLFQQTSAYTILAAIFGRSLMHGREPLCTRWATVVHGQLPAAVARYTRRVTLAWTVFFVLMSFTLVALFVFAPLHLWSVFANFWALPLVLAMFVAEYIVRRHALGAMKHAGILAGVRAYIDSSRDAAATRQR
jgi:uncharacterized membrane protein